LLHAVDIIEFHAYTWWIRPMLNTLGLVDKVALDLFISITVFI